VANGSTIPEVEAAYKATGRPPELTGERRPTELEQLRAEVAELRGHVLELLAGLERVEAAQVNTAAILAPAAVELATVLSDVRRLGAGGWLMRERKKRRHERPD
jgi:hypothetical protein